MNNKLVFSILSLGVLLCAKTYAGGVYVGNGGDAVFCRSSENNSFKGYYALDYLMTLTNANEVASVKSWEASRDRIRALLAKGAPSLLESFDSFLGDLDNQVDWTKKRIWLSAPHGLVDIQDEQIRRKLPENCGWKNLGSIEQEMVQVVVRNKQPHIVRYEYDEEVFNKLKAAPVQISFLLVHEWLWDHSEDPQIIRWTNQFLHSQHAETLSASDFNTSLVNIGITAKPSAFLSVCERSPGVAKSIVDLFRKSCEFVTPEELNTKVDHIFTNDSRLTIYDLAGMTRLNQFSLADSAIYYLPVNLFETNPYLEYVEFVNLPNLNSIPEAIFANNPKIVKLTIQNVGWSPESLDFLKGKPLSYLTLQGLKQQTLPKDFLAPLGAGIFQIDLSGGSFKSVEPGFFAAIKNKHCKVFLTRSQFTPEVVKQMRDEAESLNIKVHFN
ncbi:hypothetical protein [Bdellovibrio sp. HCB337]|uniref:hypothetical protein n=1 Tax=Bdellovibrio sp. HCB337 TaxID=3394358 RepID=UPI0039A5E2CB